MFLNKAFGRNYLKPLDIEQLQGKDVADMEARIIEMAGKLAY